MVFRLYFFSDWRDQSLKKWSQKKTYEYEYKSQAIKMTIKKRR